MSFRLGRAGQAAGRVCRQLAWQAGQEGDWPWQAWQEAGKRLGRAGLGSWAPNYTITKDSSGFIDPMASFGMPTFDPTGTKSDTHAHVSHHGPNSSGYDKEEDDLGFGNSSSRKRKQSLKDDPSENASSQDTVTPENLSSNKLAAKIEDKSKQY
ncbi:hypothetical protein BY996DRAFT_8420154 [Phakopsora pachyrhizi]|nr:hypothetical protein BY996DRAFT_8420154 [Phakopsora pachyrhizi]